MSSPLANFFATELRRMYGSLSSWLTPPYLYIIINAIIISIVAASRYQKPVVDDGESRAELLLARTGGDESRSLSVAAEPEEEEYVVSRSSWLVRKGEGEDSPEKFTGDCLPVDKPLVSSRLGRRKSIKASPEGKALGVLRPRKNETLENTWRTLTEGRAVPLARHLKKSDTCATHARPTAGDPNSPPATHEIEKFESFAARPSDAAGGYSSPVAKLRRQSSVGQDDLNRRVEAFIRKFNEEMRLQRQVSLQKYKDMINRGSH